MLGYSHRWYDGSKVDLATGKVVCVGRNYVAHAQELGNALPTAPILFMKANTSLVPIQEPISIPSLSNECHYETELALLVGEKISSATPEKELIEHIAGYGLALDLTLRDLQNKLRNQGHPWEIAKAFDRSCPTTPFFPKQLFNSPICFRLKVNEQLRQEGTTENMVFSIPKLLDYMRQFFTLLPGDIVLTGTPQGVAALEPGDRLELTLEVGAHRKHFETIVI